MNIYQKMHAITKELGVVRKNLEIEVNKNRKYSAVSERDVLDAVKPLLDKYGVYAYPFSRELVEKDMLVTTSQYGDKQSLYFHFKNVMRFVNIEAPEEYIDIPTYSTGIDTGDKADGKAMTYGDKYAFMKAFMMSTGDDPDQEASKEYKAMISNDQWNSLNRMYSKEEIKEMYKELGITNGKNIPADYFDKKKKEYDEKFAKEHPEQQFY